MVTAALADVSIQVPIAEVAPAESREGEDVRALVEAARAGDREAFGCLVTRYEHVAARTARAALGRREDADDVVQEAFLLAWSHLPRFRGDATFRTWLLTIVWRRALSVRRSGRRWWQWVGTSDRDARAWDPPDLAAGPEDSVVARDLGRRLAREIGRLSPKLRDALLLAATGEHSYEEIARVLGVRPGTIKWRVSEARRQVAARMNAEKRP